MLILSWLLSGTLGETGCFVFDLGIRLSLDLFQSLTSVWIISAHNENFDTKNLDLGAKLP
jgi:hypothetical protein